MSDVAPAPDPAVERAERRLALLRELSEIAMDLARDLRDRALAETAAAKAAPPLEAEESPPPAPVPPRSLGRDPAKSFASLSRAIRLTLTLEAKTDEALRDLLAGVTRRAEEQTRLRSLVRTASLRCYVSEAAQAEGLDEAEIDRLEADLAERLDVQDQFWGDPDRPLREDVETLCRAYGLSPDWSLWTDKGWIDEIGGPPWISDWAPREPSQGEAAATNGRMPAEPASLGSGLSVAADAPALE